MVPAAAETPVDPFDVVLRTHDEARAVAAEAAAVCTNAWGVGEALTELLANAIEHGNLGIGYELKRDLLARGAWDAELARRFAVCEQAGRVVRLTRARVPEGWQFEIADEGEGFDWVSRCGARPEPSAPNGRGILLAQALSGAILTYVGKGNRVRFVVPQR
jgi:hypothetical protein